MEHDLKTPKEWEKETGITVLDADGWRGRTGRDYSDEISEEEFRYRASFSTIRATGPVYRESTEEALDEAMNSGPDEGEEGEE
jgi:hypothetical protein